MKRTHLRLAALALALTLTALPAIAGERAARPAKAPSLLSWVWQTLGRFVPALDAARQGLDPNGGSGEGATITSSPAPEDDNDGRGTMDPNGSDPNG